MTLDAHAHILIPQVLRQAGQAETWLPRLVEQDGHQVIEWGGRQIRSIVNEFVHVEGILQAQERAGVEHTLLCPWVNLLGYDLPRQESLRFIRLQNEALARLAADHPGRISALGSVPLQDPELAARELQALCRQTPLCGVEIAASVNGVYLGDDCFTPFWAAAEQCGAFIFVHPTTHGFDAPVFQEYYLWNSVGNPLETTLTAAHMLMAGVMERHPRLKVMLAHGGGAILSLLGRLEHAHDFQPQARARLQEAPGASLKRFYFDTLTHAPGALRLLLDFAGPQHLLLGSDYPFDMGAARPAEIVRSLSLSPTDEALILDENARRLLAKEELPHA